MMFGTRVAETILASVHVRARQQAGHMDASDLIRALPKQPCQEGAVHIWLMLTVRDAIPKPRDLANAEFSTLRLRLIKIAARVIETATRVRLAFAAGCPEADLFRGLPGALAPLGP